MKYLVTLFLIVLNFPLWAQTDIVKDSLIKLASTFKFVEGPCTDVEGNLYFSDIIDNKIYKWTLDNKLETIVHNTNWGNGIYINKKGKLWQCEIKGKQITRYTSWDAPEHLVNPNLKNKLNGPNDLWLMPNGGIYFSDPDYSQKESKSNEAVYYLAPNSDEPIQVTFDLLRPNGLVGTSNGKKLFITDHLDNKTWFTHQKKMAL
ncbi:gluconolactonase [Jejuia pallidilutea]|uniref:Gluconolactonase n=1 Tax=Jejuia pallidilutea TaxID=504487 RepID=A0A090VUK7_9FLAO|nr:SMP-30/gluconolactonase/LRE family protein [Jejuia pallidilutea]GAL68405.1 gluconolactonase [Jejuia pallidilutea]